MSKEQTPIEYVSGIVISAYDHKVKNDRIINAVEKAINVAVLEVLERYQNKLSEGYDQESFEWHRQQLKKFIETEVKEKYKQ